MKQISGKFDVKLKPLPSFAQGKEGVSLGRMSIEKTFYGPLNAQSEGEMLNARTSVPGAAGYVAIEQVVGALEDKKGTFVLQHYGLMGPEQQILKLEVIPGSASGELKGLLGQMTIQIEADAHFYTFNYHFE